MPTTPFVPFDTQYSAHTDVTIHPVTGVVTITVAFHPNNKGPYNCKVWELRPPYTDPPVEIRNYVQGVASTGPFGHGASVALPTGGLLTVVPVAGDSSEVEPSILVDAERSTTPYPLLSELEQRIKQLEARLAALPPTTTGSVVYIPAQAPPVEGGELQLADGNGGIWVLDIFHGRMRRFHRDAQGVASQEQQIAP